MSIASEITRLQGAKADLATAIEGKGVTVPSATKLDGYADLVDAISQGGGTLGTKTITANGTYNASSDGYDGYSKVTANVPNSYSASDEGKVVSNGALVSQTTGYITENGTYTTTTNNEVIANVPNTYSASDEGKVVSNGALVAQTAHADVTPTTSDQTIDTTTNNSIKVKGDADLVAGNIKKDVEIFGVTGSYEGSGGTYTCDDFIDRYVSTSDFESTRTVTITGLKFGNGFRARSLRLLNATGGSMYGCQYFLAGGTPVHFLVIPKAGDISVDMIKNVTTMEGVEIGSPSYIRATAFTGCSSLASLVIRKTGVVTLANVNAFTSSPFASGGTGGTLYVPADQIASYQAASNWSTILGYTNNQIKSIESTHTDPNAPIDLTTHYVDGTLIPT